jgi:hypothetical protein
MVMAVTMVVRLLGGLVHDGRFDGFGLQPTGSQRRDQAMGPRFTTGQCRVAGTAIPS